MHIKIVSRYDEYKVLFDGDTENLSKANLPKANLIGANLYGANLSEANLSEANLSWANLSKANLIGANLYGANLYGANLSEANLSKANLYGANLYGANLYEVNLIGANLSKTKLEPNKEIAIENTPKSKDYRAYRKIAGWRIGYRTRNSSKAIPGGGSSYNDGMIYQSPLFSVDVNQDCDHGLYFCRSKEELGRHSESEDVIMIAFDPKQSIQFKNKARTRAFIVIGKA